MVARAKGTKPSPTRVGALVVVATVSLGGAGCDGCDAPSSGLDGGDLMGVFDRDAAAPGGIVAAGPASGAPADAGAPDAATAGEGSAAPIVDRKPPPGGCVPERGTPERETRRTAGRSACKFARILEWQDPSGAPRYGCVYGHDRKEAAKRPLVVFFHDATTDPSSLRKMTSLPKRAIELELNDPAERGFVVMAPQGRAIRGGVDGLVFDTEYTGGDNADVLTVDHFVDELVREELVDPQRVYTMGAGTGAKMATTYAMLRPDRVAAFASFASDEPVAEWACPTPPPPAVIVYRACDAVTPCQSVEGWLERRETASAETLALRLGAANKEEPLCDVGRGCGVKSGTANHQRWPKEREPDMLAFLARFRLRR